MSRRRLSPAIDDHLVPRALRAVRAAGEDPGPLIRAFGLGPRAEDAETLALSLEDSDAILDAATELVGAPSLAIRLASAPLEGPARLHEVAASTTATLRDAFRAIVAYAPLIHPRARFELREGPDEVTLHTWIVGRPADVGRFGNEYGVAAMLANARQRTGVALAARRVWFRHSPPGQTRDLERYFGTRELAFGKSDNGLALAAAAMDLPMRQHDPRLFAAASRWADDAVAKLAPNDKAIAEGVRRVLGEAADDATPSIDAIARRLRMSARTLQRRLAEEGTAVRVLVDEVRTARARAWLHEGVSLSEIAGRLGFSDARSFARAFRRWTGQAPSAYRSAGR